MTRVKFLLFSLLVLGAWAAHLYLLTPALSARAVEQAEERAVAGPAAMSAALQNQQMALQRTALKLASNPAALAAVTPARAGRIEAPKAEDLVALKTALADSVPESLRGSLILAIANDAGVIASRGDDNAIAADAFDVAAVKGAGAEGVARDAFGESHYFFSVPVSVVTGGEVKTLSNVVVGAPLVSKATVDDVAKQAGVGAVMLLKDGKVVFAGGSKKDVPEQTILATALGKSSVIQKGQLSSMGPLKFPFLTEPTDAMGGGAPLWVGSRQALSATPFEIVTIASVGPFMSALADYQQLAVYGFGALFGLTLVFTLIMGGGSKSQEQKKDSAGPSAQPLDKAASASAAAPLAQKSADPLPELPPVPEANPDDFQFASSSSYQAIPPEGEAPPPPATESNELHGSQNAAFGDSFFGQSSDAPPPAPELPEEPATRAADIDPMKAFSSPGPENYEQTMAYPAGADPFALASQSNGGQPADGDYNPDATRVATIPQELIRASASARHESVAQPKISASFAPPPVSAGASNPDETHFQDVFQDFVRTREQCGEPPDGLTYEKFALKLRKNKEQLVAKYSCRTVRFQVYVKEGKAALKATPVKD